MTIPFLPHVRDSLADTLFGYPKKISMEITSYFDSRANGIIPSFTNSELQHAMQRYDHWEKNSKAIWHQIDDRKPITYNIGDILKQLHGSDASIFRENKNIPEIERKVACWAILSANFEQFSQRIEKLLKKIQNGERFSVCEELEKLHLSNQMALKLSYTKFVTMVLAQWIILASAEEFIEIFSTLRSSSTQDFDGMDYASPNTNMRALYCAQLHQKHFVEVAEQVIKCPLSVYKRDIDQLFNAKADRIAELWTN